MRKGIGEYRVGIGASSVLMILVVIALTALSLLSLGNAHSSAALSDRNLSMTISYYQAAAQAQRMLGAMDELEKEYAAESSNTKDWNTLLATHGLQAITVDEDGIFSFSLDAGAQRSLAVEGEFTPDSVPRYTLTRHELTAAAESQESSLNLLIP
jgi:hypothetical protein